VEMEISVKMEALNLFAKAILHIFIFFYYGKKIFGKSSDDDHNSGIFLFFSAEERQIIFAGTNGRR
jgi:hypothetical protein